MITAPLQAAPSSITGAEFRSGAAATRLAAARSDSPTSSRVMRGTGLRSRDPARRPIWWRVTTSGSSAAGTTALGNGVTGVVIDGAATNNTIGNVVSGNLYGVGAVGTGTSGNLFTDNLIGVVVTAGTTSPLPNSVGVLLQSGATNNTVGGSSRAAANVISGNSERREHIGIPAPPRTWWRITTSAPTRASDTAWAT